MKKITFTILVSAVLAALVVYFWNVNFSSLSEEKEQISGAYEALNFLGAAKTYPTGTIPEKAHFAAWEKMQDMVADRGNPPTEPWETMGPHNKGGRTLALAFNPQNHNTLYAGSASGGLWVSYTAGVGVDAWQRVPTGFPVLGVSTIAIDPTDSLTMYIGTGEVYNAVGAGTGAAYRATRGSYGMGVLKTTDGGLSWQPSLDWTYQQQKGVWAVKIAPTNSDLLYAATTDGVYKSTDAGANWELMLEVIMASDLVIHPDDPEQVIVGCGNFNSPGAGIYSTTDGGQNWQQAGGLPTGFEGKIHLNYAPSQPDIVYASIGNGFSSANGASWLYRSEDFGGSWELKSDTDYSRWQGWFSHDVAVSTADPNQIAVIGINIWTSLDGGTNLNIASTGGASGGNPPIGGPEGPPSYVHSDAHDVIYHPTEPNTFYIATDGGVFRSLDNGDNFEAINGRYQTVQFYNGNSVSFQDSTFSMGGLQDNGTIRWNGDLTWTHIFGGDGSWSAIHPMQDDTFYVSWQGLNINRTFNDGNSFIAPNVPQLNFAAFIAPFVISPTDGNILYAGSGGIAKSTDAGISWSLMNGGNGLDGSNPVLSMEIAWDNPEVVYAATAPTTIFGGVRGQVFVTTDGGDTWQNITGDLPDRYPMDMTVDPTNEAVAFVTYSGFGTGHVFRTEDYGVTWEDISGDLPDVPHNAVIVDPLFPHNIYVGNDLGVFVSVDNGSTWMSYMEGLTDAIMAFDLKISPSNRKLRVGTHGNGMYQRDLLEEPLVNTYSPDLAVTKMEVFPNPFQQQTTIQYELKTAQNIKIRVVDATGRLVQILEEERRLAGQHQTVFIAGNLASGMYYVQLMTEGGVATEKVIIQ